jgi:type III pantothenate kinase
MLLALDVGNSNLHLAEFIIKKQPKLLNTYYYPQTQEGRKQFLVHLKKYSSSCKLILSDAYGVTRISDQEVFEAILKKFSWYYILRPDNFFGLKICYQPKTSLGTDRLASAYGAYLKYQRDSVIVDFGTATTINLVTKQGIFRGGLILPGLQKLKDGYPRHLLEKITLPLRTLRPQPISITTAQGLQSGLYYAIMTPIIEVIKNYQKIIKKKLFLIGTGGAINLYPPVKKIFNIIDANLTLWGLAYIYQNINEVSYD